MTACPCSADRDYADCCGRYLSGGQLPPTAEALMRSRYTAFARQNANWLYASLLPAKREKNELKSLQKSFRGITWTQLEVLATDKGGAQDSEGTVEFRAHCTANGETATIHERSSFVKQGDRWYYVDGEMLS